MKRSLVSGTVLVALFAALTAGASASTTWYVDGVNGSDNNNCKSQQSAYVAFSPEREDPGNTSVARRDIPKVVGGLDAKASGVIDPLTGEPELRAVLGKDGNISDLGTFGGNESASIAANDRGQLIGVAPNAIPDPFSFFGATQARAFSVGARSDAGPWHVGRTRRLRPVYQRSWASERFVLRQLCPESVHRCSNRRSISLAERNGDYDAAEVV